MLYNIFSRCNTPELIAEFGERRPFTAFFGPPIELTGEQVVSAIIKHGRAEITVHDSDDTNLVTRTIEFQNDYD